MNDNSRNSKPLIYGYMSILFLNLNISLYFILVENFDAFLISCIPWSLSLIIFIITLLKEIDFRDYIGIAVSSFRNDRRYFIKFFTVRYLFFSIGYILLSIFINYDKILNIIITAFGAGFLTSLALTIVQMHLKGKKINKY